MSVTTTYHLRPVSAMTRSASPTTSSSTTSDRSPPPLGVHTHAHRDSKAFLPPATASFSPIPTSARPRRPLSPTSLRDVDPPLDPERAFAARGKFPAPPTGHELMALFPPAPPPVRPGPTSGYFQREERKFFAQAGKEIVRVRLEIDTPAGVHHHPPPNVGGPGVPSPTQTNLPPHPHRHPHSHLHAHQHPHPHAHHHDRQASGPSPGLPPPPPPPHSTSPRSHLPPGPGFPVASPQGPPPALGGPGAPAHPGYPVHSPPSISSRPPEPERHPGRGVGGGAGDSMVVEDDDDAWRHPTPHNARRRAGKHTRRVIVK
ncbi:hypothetical protein BV20DRAFT_374445 [Pilatotrama ljubarskyi]|nr:hypothetical protein BV20DRAFT_374445 [Pilatotrama ljubarskyi]